MIRLFRSYCAAIVWVLVLGYCFLPAQRVHATESAMSAAPAILESVLNPESPTLTIISVQNNTNFPLPIKGSASAFLANENLAPEKEETFDASKWITLDPSDFILQPHEVKKIKVTITPPKDAEPGGHYATIFFRPLIPADAVSASSTISLARIGVLTMMIYPGEIKNSLDSSPLAAPTWQSFGPINFGADLTNSGSIHTLPVAKLTIHNYWGKQVAEIVHPPSIVLPGTTKSFNFVWDRVLLLGHYKATLAVDPGSDQSPLAIDPISFWIFPWPVILFTICCLTLTYKIFIVNRRRLVLALAVLKGKYEPS